jgi:hypothetical protein
MTDLTQINKNAPGWQEALQLQNISKAVNVLTTQLNLTTETIKDASSDASTVIGHVRDNVAILSTMVEVATLQAQKERRISSEKRRIIRKASRES